MSGSSVVCLSPTPTNAFTNVSITIQLDEKYALPASLSATSSELTILVPIPDRSEPLLLHYTWQQIIMHSIIDSSQMFILIECDESHSPETILSSTSPKLQKIFAKINQAKDEGDTTHNNDNEMNNNQDDEDNLYSNDMGDDDNNINSYQLIFNILSPPQEHFDLLFDESLVDEGTTLESIKSSPIQLLYHLFNQCARLNPDENNDEANIMGFGMNSDDNNKFIGFDDESLLNGTMFTAEYFLQQEQEEKLQQQQNGGNNNQHVRINNDDEYDPADEQRYKH